MTVITRFAPSPTGYLHIGGARTALFNWLFSKHTGGKFLLRIEDTDRERSTQQAIDAILDGLSWLGLNWDGEPVYQFARAARHAEIAHQLLEKGMAYKCYCTPEELKEMREQAMKEGRPPRYNGRWRDRDPSEAPPGVKPAIRIKAPQAGEVVIDDKVQGTVRVGCEQLDDMILLRSDGTPTYMLAVVVDDHDMNITHVIRGDDHLTNAFRQALIYQAMGWATPIFAHIPLIHGSDGAKLSKRHGALGVETYRDMGYLPETMRNYLLRLGWAHGDEEIISTEKAIEWFSLEAVGKSPARFDMVKLDHLNGHYIRESNDNRLAELTQPKIEEMLALPLGEGGRAATQRAGRGSISGDSKSPEIATPHASMPSASQPLPPKGGATLTPNQHALLVKAMPGLKARAKNLNELAESALFYFRERPLPMTPQAEALLSENARALLAAYLPELEKAKAWTHKALEDHARAYAEKHAQKLGAIAQPLRAALTGSHISPSTFEVMEILGKDESLARIMTVL